MRHPATWVAHSFTREGMGEGLRSISNLEVAIRDLFLTVDGQA